MILAEAQTKNFMLKHKKDGIIGKNDIIRLSKPAIWLLKESYVSKK